MKIREIIAVSAISLFAACGTPYQATDTVVVAPASITNSFDAQYPGATNVVWSNYDGTVVIPMDWELAGWTVLDTDDFVVRYNLDNEDYYSWYEDDGTWVGTAIVVRDHSTMPSVVSGTISSQFPGYTISSVTREIVSDRVNYEVELKNSTTKVKVLLDSNGNIIRQKSKVND